MKKIYPLLVFITLLPLMWQSCDDLYGPRKESTPVVVTATIAPSSFTFGDSVMLSATITDPSTMLTSLHYEVISDGRTVATGEIPLNGDTAVINTPLFVPLLSNQADNAKTEVHLIVRNVLKGVVTHQITGLTAHRPVYDRLFLVTDNGTVAVLDAGAGNHNKYTGSGLTLDPAFRYRIAERLHTDGTIDFSGDVYGNVNGRVAMIGKNGESAFIYTPDADYTKTITFDHAAFTVTAVGDKLGADDLALSAFGNQDIDNESFRTLTRTLEKEKTYTLFGVLADAMNVYNPDFFARVSASKVKFLGETGDYTLYFNPVRKNIFVGVANPSYPDYLLACGWGLGYPTRVSSAEISSVYPGRQRTHTSWGFGNVMNYVLLRRIGDGIYQGTFYTPGDQDHYAGFKPFENTGWANEKKAGAFTFTGEQIISGDNDWTIPNGANDPIVESAHYRFTINLKNNTVHIEKTTI